MSWSIVRLWDKCFIFQRLGIELNFPETIIIKYLFSPVVCSAHWLTRWLSQALFSANEILWNQQCSFKLFSFPRGKRCGICFSSLISHKECITPSVQANFNTMGEQVVLEITVFPSSRDRERFLKSLLQLYKRAFICQAFFPLKTMFWPKSMQTFRN